MTVSWDHGPIENNATATAGDAMHGPHVQLADIHPPHVDACGPTNVLCGTEGKPMTKPRTMSDDIRTLFLLSERIHSDAMRRVEENENAKRVRDMRTCKRFPIGTDARVLRVARVSQ